MTTVGSRRLSNTTYPWCVPREVTVHHVAELPCNYARRGQHAVYHLPAARGGLPPCRFASASGPQAFLPLPPLPSSPPPPRRPPPPADFGAAAADTPEFRLCAADHTGSPPGALPPPALAWPAPGLLGLDRRRRRLLGPSAAFIAAPVSLESRRARSILT